MSAWRHRQRQVLRHPVCRSRDKRLNVNSSPTFGSELNETFYFIVTFTVKDKRQIQVENFSEKIGSLSNDNSDDNENGKKKTNGFRSGAPKENVVQNHLNIALLNVF